MAIPVKLPVFEGPLDLLLHLIDRNKIDIYDIPIVEITDQYMEYIQQMKETKAPLLSSISNGVHTHLVETETEEEMEAIHRALEKLGILVK